MVLLCFSGSGKLRFIYQGAPRRKDEDEGFQGDDEQGKIIRKFKHFHSFIFCAMLCFLGKRTVDPPEDQWLQI
jgi:hypothetical protein